MPWYEFAVPGAGWNIPSGGVPSPQTPYLVRWLDYKGNVVRQQYAAAGQSFSNPAAPIFSGLDFWGWSGSPALITSDIDIVGVWTPTDGKRTLSVEASALVGLTPVLKVVKSDTSTLTVDWGDGTTSTSSAAGNVTITKDTPYVAGSYQIKPYISSGAGTFSGGHGTSGNPMLAGVAVTEYWATPDVISVAAYALNGTEFRTMAYATGFSACTSFRGYAALNCYSLVSLSLPACTSFGGYAALNCYSLVSLSLPACTSFGANAVQSCRNLTNVRIGPNCTAMDALCLDGSRKLRTLRVEATIPPTLASVASIADFDPRMLIYVPSASVAAYKAATNWSAFESRIVGY